MPSMYPRDKVHRLDVKKPSGEGLEVRLRGFYGKRGLLYSQVACGRSFQV